MLSVRPQPGGREGGEWGWKMAAILDTGGGLRGIVQSGDCLRVGTVSEWALLVYLLQEFVIESWSVKYGSGGSYGSTPQCSRGKSLM